MNLERYEFSTQYFHINFEFFSEGPKGKIKKIVQPWLENSNGVSYFNLGFGDWNEEKKDLDDVVRTNNYDVNKVLSTIAAIVLTLTKTFPDLFVYATGSTPARTRLYQMGIAARLQEIESILYVYGKKDNDWHQFKKGINYEAFLVRRR